MHFDPYGTCGVRSFDHFVGAAEVRRRRGQAERVVAFYSHRGTCEQWIKEGKIAVKSTRLSCCSFAANAVRLQLHALAYNLGNFILRLIDGLRPRAAPA